MVVGNRPEGVQIRNDPAFQIPQAKQQSSDRLLANIVYTVTPSCMDLVRIRGSRYTLQPFATGKCETAVV